MMTWTVEPQRAVMNRSRVGWAIKEHGRTIAVVDEWPSKDTKATADLMADAPRFLDALRSIASQLETRVDPLQVASQARAILRKYDRSQPTRRTRRKR
jgi:hypothetical protein